MANVSVHLVVFIFDKSCNFRSDALKLRAVITVETRLILASCKLYFDIWIHSTFKSMEGGGRGAWETNYADVACMYIMRRRLWRKTNLDKIETAITIFQKHTNTHMTICSFLSFISCPYPTACFCLPPNAILSDFC